MIPAGQGPESSDGFPFGSLVAVLALSRSQATQLWIYNHHVDPRGFGVLDPQNKNHINIFMLVSLSCLFLSSPLRPIPRTGV